MNSVEIKDRLLSIAKDRLRNSPGAYFHFQNFIEHSLQGTTLISSLPFAIPVYLPFETSRAQLVRVDGYLIKEVIDKWAHNNPTNIIEPLPEIELLPIASTHTHIPTVSLRSALDLAAYTTSPQRKIEYLQQPGSLSEALVKTAHLLALPTKKLDELCAAKFEETRERVESARHYSLPAASTDYSYLRTLGHWTGPETVAFLLEKNLEFVERKYLKKFFDQDERELQDFQNLGLANVGINQYLTKRFLKLIDWLSRAAVFIPETAYVDPVSALRVAKADGLFIPAQLEAALAGKKPRPVQALTIAPATVVMPEPQAAPVVPVVPVMTVGTLDDTRPTNWRHLIQAEAYQHWLRLRASGCNPSVHSICEDMAKWCVEKNIKGDKGQNPRGGTIRNTVLGGSSGWKPPYHSVTEAKKHLAQIAQTAQSEVAHTAR